MWQQGEGSELIPALESGNRDAPRTPRKERNHVPILRIDFSIAVILAADRAVLSNDRIPINFFLFEYLKIFPNGRKFVIV